MDSQRTTSIGIISRESEFAWPLGSTKLGNRESRNVDHKQRNITVKNQNDSIARKI